MSTPTIDFEAIKNKVSQMSSEERAKKLADFRTRQLFQQKKQAAKGGQAAYNKRRNEEFKEMRALAENTPANDPKYKNLWEEINAQAAEAAEAKFDEYLDKELETAPEE